MLLNASLQKMTCFVLIWTTQPPSLLNPLLHFPRSPTPCHTFQKWTGIAVVPRYPHVWLLYLHCNVLHHLSVVLIWFPWVLISGWLKLLRISGDVNTSRCDCAVQGGFSPGSCKQQQARPSQTSLKPANIKTAADIVRDCFLFSQVSCEGRTHNTLLKGNHFTINTGAVQIRMVYVVLQL